MIKNLSEEDRRNFYKVVLSELPEELQGLYTVDECMERITLMTHEQAPKFYAYAVYLKARDKWFDNDFSASEERKTLDAAYAKGIIDLNYYSEKMSAIYKAILESDKVAMLNAAHSAIVGEL